MFVRNLQWHQNKVYAQLGLYAVLSPLSLPADVLYVSQYAQMYTNTNLCITTDLLIIDNYRRNVIIITKLTDSIGFGDCIQQGLRCY